MPMIIQIAQNAVRLSFFAVVSCAVQACTSVKDNGAGRNISLPGNKANEPARVTKVLVCRLGFREDKNARSSVIAVRICHNRRKSEWLYQQVNRKQFTYENVPNWSSSYFLVFMGSKNDVVCALECIDDTYQFVGARKTLLSCYVGPPLIETGKKQPRWQLPGLEDTAWSISQFRLVSAPLNYLREILHTITIDKMKA